MKAHSKCSKCCTSAGTCTVSRLVHLLMAATMAFCCRH